MKLTLAVILALSVLVTATLAPAAEQAKRAVDCNNCNDRFQFCVQNGRTKGQEGCEKTCAQHVCFQTSECSTCGGDLGACPDVSRYSNNGCGGKPCPGYD